MIMIIGILIKGQFNFCAVVIIIVDCLCLCNTCKGVYISRNNVCDYTNDFNACAEEVYIL